jgi:hypothetical protein
MRKKQMKIGKQEGDMNDQDIEKGKKNLATEGALLTTNSRLRL